MKVNFMMGINMAEVIKYFKMEILIMELMLKINFKDKDNINGKMELFIKVLFLMDINMGKDC